MKERGTVFVTGCLWAATAWGLAAMTPAMADATVMPLAGTESTTGAEHPAIENAAGENPATVRAGPAVTVAATPAATATQTALMTEPRPAPATEARPAAVPTPAKALAPPARVRHNVMLNWADFVSGKRSDTIAVITPSLEYWALNWNTKNNKDLEIGKLFPLKGKFFSKLKVGGYLVSFPDSHKWELLPWVTLNDTIGKARLNINLGQYIPLNGGPRIFFSTESSLVVPATSKLDIGISTSFGRVNAGPAPFSVGPTLRYRLSDSNFLKLNWQPWAVNPPLSAIGGRAASLGAVPSKLRVQLTTLY